MAPHRRRAADTASVGLYLQATLLACLLFAAVTRAASSSQTDEDLIFEEEGIMRTRRDIEVAPVEAPLPEEQPSFLTRVRRQFSFLGFGSNAPTDDEDEIGSAGEEGSGGEQLRIYRAKVHVVKDWRSSLGNMNSPDFVALARDLERNLEVALRRISGDKTVKVSSMRRSDPGKILATVDINYMGWSDETEAMRRAIRSVLDSQYLGTIPVNSQFFSFEEPKAARPSCPAGQHRCPSGRCVKRCDGRAECLDGSDELNCVVEVDVVPTSGITSGSAAPTCRSDDQGPNVCRDGRTFACFCDGKVECPDGGDEDDCPYTGCETNELSCDDGTSCIQESKQCDGVEDCFDGTDEKNCPSVVPCARNQYQCKTGECIDDFRHCDYMKDCPGGEDEEFCPCKPDEYECNSGQCVGGNKRCDGVPDCDDETDETVGCPCDPSSFTCRNGQCVDLTVRCDGEPDCDDQSDEHGCPACSSGAFLCGNNQCIPEENVCDGNEDCDTDELNCCEGSGMFECDSGDTCLSEDRLCDGVNDCSDGFDESQCPGEWCPEGKYMCKNGDCIDIAYRCDGLTQCQDQSDEIDCPCGPDQWRCRDGLCIPKRSRCNRYFDCPDYSDEENCQPACRPTEWTCRDGSCIPGDAHCNGYPDCRDGSDEEDCPRGCNSEEWTCRDGSCVALNQRCDGEPQCLDRSDEENCPPNACSPGEWTCLDGSCIPEEKRCDRYYDCPDYTDEAVCPPTPACSPGEWTCKDESCIPEDRRCDGRYDCPDYTDEDDCSSVCGPNEWSCRDGSCIPLDAHCDQVYHCIDRSDEENCALFCDPGKWKCGDGSCILLENYCNGVPDCPDYSDEEDCVEECRSDEWRCLDGTCIRQENHCDGTPHCLDRSDEENCARPCGPSEWTCRDKSCIPLQARCDSQYDCRDYSDEENCPACGPGEWRCSDGSCIPAQERCDRQFDCRDYSDEDNCPACRPGEWSCRDGSCIPVQGRCDRQYDCRDYSDEENCPVCGPGEWSCKDGSCIPLQGRCDNQYNCRDYSDEQDCPEGCRPGEWRCVDGTCIPQEYRCDQIPQCLDRSDEENCGRPRPCGRFEWTCRDGSCIPLQARCDNFYHCRDYSDEDNCPDRCRPREWRCLDGTCIPEAYHCDGVPQCLDRSDEENCVRSCTPSEWTCRDGSCIPLQTRCDNRYDCRDYSDEENCAEGCRPDEWRCSDGNCIPRTYRCDRIPQCLDHSDEEGCARPRPCPPGQWTCRADGSCIPFQARCDNIYDCSDYSDEAGCQACGSDQWTCRDGSCIPIQERCDNWYNCRDFSDEENCQVVCGPGEWRCRDGACIPLDNRCDRTPHCIDRSDEENCPLIECAFDEYTCKDDSCIPLSGLCNGASECPDGSDEIDCKIACRPGEWQCGDGTCIRENQRCNGQIDCRDYTDENECAPTSDCRHDQFRCEDNSCIELSQRCNGRAECLNGEDERGCPCSPDEFRCQRDGQCIDSRKQCDGRNDCSDGSDELNCRCPAGEWRCLNGQCIPSAYRCDGRQDCSDRSDETVECPPPPPRPPAQPCDVDQFECRNGRCISRAFLCDGIPDCTDGSDEINENCLERECTGNEFRCTDGVCISSDWKCDNVPDCSDGSDETGCVTPCKQTEYQCGDGTCIPESERCDGIFDCADQSDERDNCCHSDEFQCRNGDCIPSSQRCNGYPECVDHSDEHECIDQCTSSEFTCGSGECISSNVVCDGRFDCTDGSDERENCVTADPVVTPRQESCTVDQFKCRNGFCIDQYQLCDGRQDCSDGSDEDNCGPRCQPYEFQCRGGRCISRNARCDGRRDCLDGSDEIDCLITTPYTPFTPPTPTPSAASGPPPPRNYFICKDGGFIENFRRCDGRRDCNDGSDEDERCKSQTDTIDLKTYPDEQTIQQTREVVFQCRDEGTIRAPVRWTRDGNRPMPPGTTDVRGRLTIPNVQVEHSGRYYCEAQGVPLSTPGRTKPVNLQVIPYVRPTPPTLPPVCRTNEATCMNGQCIPRTSVCNGVFDCDDASDEMRCNPLGCEPNEYQCDNKRCVLKTWMCDSDDDCGDGSDERNCVTNPPGSPCLFNEFTCHIGNQCIPKSFHCDNEVDCQDDSDETGCSKPLIITPPPRNLMVQAGETFVINCTAIGVPQPTVIWRLNWGHVPDKCRMTSVDGVGVLTCPSAQPTDQGAYSCEALNSRGSVFATPDCIVQVKGGASVCQIPYFNALAQSQQDCLKCFCFGATEECYSADRYITQLPPPTSSSFQLVGVNQDQFQGNYVIRNRQYPISTSFIRYPGGNDVQLLGDRSKIGGPRDLLIYFSLPDSHKGQQLSSYGGYLRYKIAFSSSGTLQQHSGPDVIMVGNNITLMHVHDGEFLPNVANQVDVRLTPGHWFKRVIGRGPVAQTQEPASREEIMMVLENIEFLLIRALYHDESFVDAKLSEVQLDTSVMSNSGQGQAIYVEECRCPEGYVGLSCQSCAPSYKRVREGPWLGRCVRDAECRPGEYGDPANGIPCQRCPCPLSSPTNQFSSSCYLDTDGQVTCNCLRGYTGRRCERCSEGYKGNPLTPGESCQPAGECNPAGSYSSSADPATGSCQCKEFVTGPKCDTCIQNSFYLNENNRYGCIDCFCMGITEQCTSSNWYRQQESVSFTNDRQGFELVDKFQQNVISNDIYVDSGRQELVFQEFSRLGQEVYYWKLPQRFLGDKVTSYGGNLTYSLRYVPTPGGQSSANAAAAVEIYGNDIVLKHYSRSQLSPSRQETVSVPLYEQYWERQDGQEANREHFLMALADLEYILIKATYTTNTGEVGLKEVILDYAEPRNTGQERAFAVEMCECPVGYQGLSCEDCAIGYTRSLSGLHLGTCIPCECNDHSEECDPEDGICTNCRDNTAGDFCDECALGFNRDASGRCIRIPGGECNCDVRGSVSTQCYGEHCQCKKNVQGEDCDSCKPGYFHLSSQNPDGCLECWCSGVSSQCFSSNYFRTQLPMQLLSDHGFMLANRLRSNVIKDGFNINVANNEISFSNFGALRDGETYYWSLPQMFTGNRLPSYGGNLTITQRYQAQSGGNQYADPDVIIRSSGGRELIWMNNRPLQPNILQTYVVPLFEENFTMNQQPASRADFLNALSSVEAVLVRATVSNRMTSTFLRDVIMDTAVSSQTGQPRAYAVEQCQCPKEYSGLSCEQCKPGYYRDTATNQCNQCPCNGREESCALRPDGRVRCDCLPGYHGDFCEESGPPPGGDPSSATISVTVSEPSIVISAVGSTVQFHCSARTITDQRRVPVTWSKLDGVLPYARSSDNRQGLLEITQIQPSDSGVYICTASDGYIVFTQNATLRVQGETAQPGAPRVRIEEPREVVEVRRGQTLEVRCSAAGSPRPQVTWSYGPNRDRLPFNVFAQNGVLIFRSAQTDVSGEYYCTASNSQGTDYARIIINIVPDDRAPVPSPIPGGPLVVQVSREIVEVRSGETVRVSCTAAIPRSVTITWSRLAGPLPSQAVVANGELQIVNARPVDSGIYVCRITDDRTSRYEESSTRITVTEYVNLPSVSIQPDRQTINQGTNAELRCIATGTPAPIITWSKANEELGPRVTVDGSILRITDAVVSDRGMYVCSARNDGGTAQAASIVEVERREPPVIEIYPEVKQTIVVGASALFQCHLTAGIPPPSVRWTRTDGRPLKPNTEVLNGGVLRFNEVKGDEEGSYTCTAENDAGSVKAVAILEIQSLPFITIQPRPSPYRVRVGQRVRLECSAQGDPAPTVSWQKLQHNFPANIPSQSALPTVAVYEIASATRADEGTYQCSARNAAGTSEERLQLIIEEEDHIQPPPYYDNWPTQPAYPQRPEQESRYSVPRGGSFELRCAGGSDRESTQIDFKRTDDAPLPRGHRIQGGVLYLNNVDDSAAGEYVCIGSDRISGSILFTIYSYIQVLAPPRITLDPRRQVVRPGDHTRIHCSATGDQPITINWSKQGGYMPPSVIINGGEMMFRGISTSDAGQYICEAVNSAGSSEAVAEVVVNEEPLLTAIQRDVLMYTGQTAELRCEVSGLTPSIVQWRRIGGSLPPGALPRGNLLRLPFIKVEDTGRYMCEARTPDGFLTSDVITLTVERSQAIPVRIEPSHRNVRIGEDIVLSCTVDGDPAAAVTWSRIGKYLPPNAQERGNQLWITNVQADNGGVYRCSVTTQNGVFDESYPLVIQDTISTENLNYTDVNTRSVKTRSVPYGTGVVMECYVSIPPPVSYTWSKQGGELPVRAHVQGATIDIPEVHTEDAGLYICTGSNNERSVDLLTLLVVTGVIPRFSGSSYITLPTLPRAYLTFDLDISFKPESDNGLILYNSQRAGSEDGDFVSFGMSGGHAEFRFDVGSGPAVIRSRAPLELNAWHTVRLSRNRKEGTMVVDDGVPVTGRSEGRFLGLDLVENMYLGSVPDFSKVQKQSGFNTGFRGCISRLVIGKTVTVDLMRDAKSKVDVGACETCAGNPCKNSGVCQEAYTETGHKCICPAGFSGGLCENTGEACYPGVCGTGRCVNKPGGFECFCPFGKVGERCERDITIVEPAFGDGAYIAYPTPKALRRFSVDMNFKPESLEDGVLMYCAQRESGEGDFTSLAIRNKRLEFRFNTGSGTALIQSDPLQQDQWVEVRANRTDRLGSMSINGGQMQNTESPGTNRGLNLVTPLFIGGVDNSRIEISPEVSVNQGFHGCVKEIKLMDQEMRLADSLVDSANVGQCGGSSASMCTLNSCNNRGQCIDNPALPHGYTCNCIDGYSGHNCEVEPGVCSIIQPCRNGGACIGSGDVYSCRCPLGFAGQHCEHDVQVLGSASFSGDSWVEFDRSMLPQEGGETQKITFEFSTVKSEGLLFWLGQEAGIPGRGQDYVSVAIVDGFVEFAYQLGTGPAFVRSRNRVNDGERHTLIVKRTGRQGSIELDGSVHEYGESPGMLHMLNTRGNIYIGGVPDLQLMTDGTHTVGFQGCIHQLTIGEEKIVNYMRLAVSGINVTRCPSSRDREGTHVSTRFDENFYSNGGRYHRRTVKTTKTVTTTRKHIHG